MMNDRFRRDDGFFLVEALIAAGLLAVVLIGLGRLLADAAIHNDTVRRITTAATLASQKLEELRAAAVRNGNGIESLGRSGDVIGAGGLVDAVYTRAWEVVVGQPRANVARVTVTVSPGPLASLATSRGTVTLVSLRAVPAP